MGRKLALIIGNSEYEDKNLARLITPTADAGNLANVLKSPDIGGFDEVIQLINEPSIRVRREIARFFGDKQRDDLLLLYFSGHGVLDDRGKLYLAIRDTERDLLKGTAIEASYISDVMDSSYSRQQVLILDCCHSGAFARGSKGTTGASVSTAQTFEGAGSGRVVLTATDATQYAWEGDQVIGQAENSVFTHYLIQGLQTGEADSNADGRITLDELYEYAHAQVVKATPKQKPHKWSFNQEGEIVVARNLNPRIKPAKLPDELLESIRDPRTWVREGAVRELDQLLNSSNAGMALAAAEALKMLSDDDSRRVSSAATTALSAYDEKRRTSEQKERLANQYTEEARLAKEKAEHKNQSREKAELERPVSFGAERESLEQKQAEQLAPSQKKFAREKTQATSILRGTAMTIWVPTLITSIAMAASNLALPVWGEASYTYTSVAVAGAIGGFATGLALRLVLRSFRWIHVGLFTAGWVLVWYVLRSSGINFGQISFLSAIGVGFLSVIAVWQAESSIRWQGAVLITVGWTVGWAVGYTILVIFIPSIFAGAVYGAIGGAVMFWQIDRAKRIR